MFQRSLNLLSQSLGFVYSIKFGEQSCRGDLLGPVRFAVCFYMFTQLLFVLFSPSLNSHENLTTPLQHLAAFFFVQRVRSFQLASSDSVWQAFIFISKQNISYTLNTHLKRFNSFIIHSPKSFAIIFSIVFVPKSLQNEFVLFILLSLCVFTN